MNASFYFATAEYRRDIFCTRAKAAIYLLYEADLFLEPCNVTHYWSPFDLFPITECRRAPITLMPLAVTLFKGAYDDANFNA